MNQGNGRNQCIHGQDGTSEPVTPRHNTPELMCGALIEWENTIEKFILLHPLERCAKLIAPRTCRKAFHPIP